MGLPLGCAEIGAVLYGQELQYNPKDPSWLNRDRFVLSAGHGSMFLYSWLHMSGYDLSMEEVRRPSSLPATLLASHSRPRRDPPSADGPS